MDDRRNKSQAIELCFGPYALSIAERVLWRAGDPIRLGSRALEILATLVEHTGEVVTHKELISSAWPHVTVAEANLRVHIAAIRKSLGDGTDGARYISNVAGRGYCFVEPVSRVAVKPPTTIFESSTSERTTKLPPRLTRMVGRNQVVQDLIRQLEFRQLVSIVGPGGVGKTTVALSVAHALTEVYRGAVFFIDLTTLADGRLVPAAVCSALSIKAQSNDPSAALLSFLGRNKLLLVFDNCEHLIDAAAELAEQIVGEAPHTRVLATSREALRTEGEYVHVLSSLECPPDDPNLTASVALQYPAVQLFVERATADGYVGGITDSNASTVAHICRKMDGIALAIELVASRTRSLGIPGIADLLANRFGMIWQGRRTASARHQTISSMLDWSYNLLLDSEKRVLTRLAILVGEFTLETACSVVSEQGEDFAEIGNAIDSLVAKSMISTRVAHEVTYYRLLDLTRGYALSKLSDQRERRCRASSCD